jgi:hypothetical protein
MTQSTLEKRLVETPMAYTGYNLSGVPLGDDDGYRSVELYPMSEDVSEDCDDPLVEVRQVLYRPMYFDMGFTTEKRLFLRWPALRLVRQMDAWLVDMIGWRIRLTDTYRPMDVQRQGFCWAVGEVLRYEYPDVSMDAFRDILTWVVYGNRVYTDQLRMCVEIVKKANNLFSYAGVVWNNPLFLEKFSDKDTHLLCFAAVNLKLAEIGRIDPYATTAHGSGGELDLEFVSVNTDLLVNMGTPVDAQGIFSHLTYFEPELGTLSLAECGWDERRRKAEYRAAIQNRADIQVYLQQCGVDPDVCLREDDSFERLWNEIRGNRRVMNHVLRSHGAFPYAGEHWHWGVNNAYGGALAQHGFVSGSACYAVHMGQEYCAWGNATALYEALLVKEAAQAVRSATSRG